MDYKKLENNIIDVIKEEQIKLGYRSETVRLYYPLSSLNNFLCTDYNIKQMHSELNNFCNYVKEKLGEIIISNKGESFCFAIPPTGTDYVHGHMNDNEFIADFINTIAKHGVKIDEILNQFYKYSDKVHFEKMKNEEFDYLLYFEDGSPDEYRYLITDEGHHMIYHRFTVWDYNDLYGTQ